MIVIFNSFHALFLSASIWKLGSMDLNKMKAYLLDIPNKYNRFSKNLDVKAILCNKSWLVFNDSGDKELYIFQENGSLITSVMVVL